MTDSIHLGLPFIEAAQAQKHVTHNEALAILDAVVMLATIDRDLSAPPGSPAEGARYLVKSPGSGAFAGKDNHVAHYLDGEWSFYAPAKGWTCYVEDEAKLVAWDGTSWQGVGGAITELQNLGLLGLGTTADATNPFAAKLNNAVWAAKSVAEGGDGNLRYKLSKESAAKTLSLLFQDNYSGRAEIGLTGDDDFHFKTSPDGSNWIDALSLDKATGSTKINAAFLLAGNISPPQITADQNDYNPTGLSAASVLRLSSDTARKITGLAGGVGGRVVVFENVGANAITIAKDDGATSTAANRFAFSRDVVLAANQACTVKYDGTAARWRLLAAPADGALRYDIDQSAALTSGQKAQIRKSAGLPYTGTTVGSLARITDTVGSQGQASSLSENGSGHVIIRPTANQNLYIRPSYRVVGGVAFQGLNDAASANVPLEVCADAAQATISGTPVVLMYNGVEKVRVDATGLGVGVTPVCAGDFNGPVRVKSYTVGTLPAASLGDGMRATVTDATAITPGTVVAGGSTHKVVVFSLNSSWYIGVGV